MQSSDKLIKYKFKQVIARFKFVILFGSFLWPGGIGQSNIRFGIVAVLHCVNKYTADK